MCVCGICFSSSVNSTLENSRNGFVALSQGVDSDPQMKGRWFCLLQLLETSEMFPLGTELELNFEERGNGRGDQSTQNSYKSDAGGPRAEHPLARRGNRFSSVSYLKALRGSFGGSCWFVYLWLKYSLLQPVDIFIENFGKNVALISFPLRSLLLNVILKKIIYMFNPSFDDSGVTCLLHHWKSVNNCSQWNRANLNRDCQ